MHPAIRALSCALLLAPAAHADVIWDESFQGDLSGDRLNPTPLALAPGANSLIATSVSGDREYVQLTIPSSLTAIVHVSWVSLDSVGFIAVQSGPTFTEPPTGTVVANLLGWCHFGPGLSTIGTDILPRMGVGLGAIGFTPPLPAGVYTFWIQQTSVNASTYRLDFIVAPTPASLLPLLALTRRHRRS